MANLTSDQFEKFKPLKINNASPIKYTSILYCFALLANVSLTNHFDLTYMRKILDVKPEVAQNEKKKLFSGSLGKKKIFSQSYVCIKSTLVLR